MKIIDTKGKVKDADGRRAKDIDLGHITGSKQDDNWG